MKRGIEDGHHRHILAENFPRRANAAYRARIVQGSDLTEGVERRDHFVVDQDRVDKAIAAVHYPMADGVNGGKFRPRAQPVDHQTYRDFMIGDLQGFLFRYSVRRFERIGSQTANAIDHTTRAFARRRQSVGLDHLELESRTAAVEHEYFHLIILC
jgi:hypothetical protein